MQVNDQSGEVLKGKSACTKFQRITANGQFSVVLCKPITGRTHQVMIMSYSFFCVCVCAAWFFSTENLADIPLVHIIASNLLD